jgi:hypothetical protein
VAGSVPKGTDAKSPQERPTRLAGYGLKVGGGRTRIRTRIFLKIIQVFLMFVSLHDCKQTIQQIDANR